MKRLLLILCVGLLVGCTDGKPSESTAIKNFLQNKVLKENIDKKFIKVTVKKHNAVYRKERGYYLVGLYFELEAIEDITCKPELLGVQKSVFTACKLASYHAHKKEGFVFSYSGADERIYRGAKISGLHIQTYTETENGWILDPLKPRSYTNDIKTNEGFSYSAPNHYRSAMKRGYIGKSLKHNPSAPWLKYKKGKATRIFVRHDMDGINLNDKTSFEKRMRTRQLTAPEQATNATQSDGEKMVTNPQVKIETTLGDITLELDATNAPISTENFISYVKDGHLAMHHHTLSCPTEDSG